MNDEPIVGAERTCGQAPENEAPSAMAAGDVPAREQLLAVIGIQAEIAKLGLDLGGVMTLVVERCVPLLAADGAAIELAEGDEMVYRAAAGIAAPQLGLRLRRESSLSGACVSAGQPLICADVETDERVDRQACRKVGLRSMIVMPLRHRGQTVGVLKLMSRRAGQFTEADAKLLALLSEVVAAAMFFATKYDSDALFHLATHDGLTGLANRALFMDRLRNAIARRGGEGRELMVLMIDMDGLKPINDHYGHRIGDEVLKEFARRLKAGARPSDTVARLGGDEFAVVLAPVDARGDLDGPLQSFRKRLDAPFSFEGRVYDLQASIGGAICPVDGTDPDRLLDVADQRMYAVKRRGRELSARAH